MVGVGPKPQITQAIECAKLVVVRWRGEEAGVGGGEGEVGSWKVVDDIGGGGEGVAPVL